LSYPLDVVSVVEAVLESPRQVLFAQQHAARGEAIAQMKADGIEYDERMELLEDVTWPKPLAELIEPAYETYRRGHPWISEFTPSPKSVVREMIERSLTFAELISRYGLARSEGLVLRYLADAYRALRRTVPEQLRTDELDDITEWLGELVRQVDSSLLDEWEQLTNPAVEMDADQLAFEAPPRPVSANERSFRVLVRNAMFRRVELLARREWDELEAVGTGPSADEWERLLQPYFDEYGSVGTGPNARGPQLFQIEKRPGLWSVRQVIDDPAGDHGWAIVGVVDLAESDEVGEVVFDEIDVVSG
jgi:hypothetical protein